MTKMTKSEFMDKLNKLNMINSMILSVGADKTINELIKNDNLNSKDLKRYLKYTNHVKNVLSFGER